MEKEKNNLLASRRNFVKNTAILGAGMMLPNMELSAMVNVFNEKTLKLAVVGCGGRGSGAANQALKADQNVQLIAMADAFEDRLLESLKNLETEFEGTGKVKVGEKNRFVGFDAYKRAIDLADVVILATPPGFRAYHFEYAINSGKHVFMEKPVATDVPGVRKVLEMAKVAKEKKLNVVVGLQRRYQNNYLNIAEKIKNGEVGKNSCRVRSTGTVGECGFDPEKRDRAKWNIRCVTGIISTGFAGTIFLSNIFIILM